MDSSSLQTRLGAYAILLDDRKILLCRLCNPDKWYGYWTLPGGSVEFGESPEQAMIREVEEETGFIARPISIAGIDTIHDSTAPYHGVRIVYHAEITGGGLRRETSGSTDHCEWHELARLHEINLVDLAREIVKWEWNPAPPPP